MPTCVLHGSSLLLLFFNNAVAAVLQLRLCMTELFSFLLNDDLFHVGGGLSQDLLHELVHLSVFPAQRW